jgi:alpha-galactosidase
MSGQLSREVEARWISSDLPADDLKAAEWGLAVPVPINRYWSGEVAPTSRHAEASLLWSDYALHVRYVCNQSEPPIINPNPKTAEKTIGLWDRDVCEIFIAPDADRPECYFEFEAAPTGEWLDLGINLTPEGRETDWEFNSGMTVAAHAEAGELRIAMRIPWNTAGRALHKPNKSERWRVNLFRCIGTGNSRYLAWQPTLTEEPNFHVPQAFGWLRFG